MTEASGTGVNALLNDRLIGQPDKELAGSLEVSVTDVKQTIVDTVEELRAHGAIKVDEEAFARIIDQTLIWAQERFFSGNGHGSQGLMTAVGYHEIAAKVMEIAALYGWDNVEIEGPTPAEAVEAFDDFSRLQPSDYAESDVFSPSDDYRQALRRFQGIMDKLPDSERREVWKIINERYVSKRGEQ